MTTSKSTGGQTTSGNTGAGTGATGQNTQQVEQAQTPFVGFGFSTSQEVQQFINQYKDQKNYWPLKVRYTLTSVVGNEIIVTVSPTQEGGFNASGQFTMRLAHTDKLFTAFKGLPIGTALESIMFLPMGAQSNVGGSNVGQQAGGNQIQGSVLGTGV